MSKVNISIDTKLLTLENVARFKYIFGLQTAISFLNPPDIGFHVNVNLMKCMIIEINFLIKYL